MERHQVGVAYLQPRLYFRDDEMTIYYNYDTIEAASGNISIAI